MRKHAFDLNDQAGKKTKLTLWYKPGNDAYGLLTRSDRMVNGADSLMEGESAVCHFHSKLMQKEPKVGGAWEWHQDYGYWYKNEFLLPGQMISIMIAITDANKENGCLQVIRGSHKMGRRFSSEICSDSNLKRSQLRASIKPAISSLSISCSVRLVPLRINCCR